LCFFLPSAAWYGAVVPPRPKCASNLPLQKRNLEVLLPPLPPHSGRLRLVATLQPEVLDPQQQQQQQQP